MSWRSPGSWQFYRAKENREAVRNNAGGLTASSYYRPFAKIHNDPRWLPFLESIGMLPEQLDAIEFNVTLPK